MLMSKNTIPSREECLSTLPPKIVGKIGRDKHRTLDTTSPSTTTSSTSTSTGENGTIIMAEREERLENVLLAMATVLPAGYCQGMNVVCGLCLETFDFDPLPSFWTAFRVLRSVQGLFSEGMPAFHMAMAFIDGYILDELPHLASRLESASVVPLMFCSAWLHTLMGHVSLPSRVKVVAWEFLLDHDPNALEPCVFVAAVLAIISLATPLVIDRPPSSSPEEDTMAILSIFRDTSLLESVLFSEGGSGGSSSSGEPFREVLAEHLDRILGGDAYVDAYIALSASFQTG